MTLVQKYQNQYKNFLLILIKFKEAFCREIVDFSEHSLFIHDFGHFSEVFVFEQVGVKAYDFIKRIHLNGLLIVVIFSEHLVFEENWETSLVQESWHQMHTVVCQD